MVSAVSDEPSIVVGAGWQERIMRKSMQGNASEGAALQRNASGVSESSGRSSQRVVLPMAQKARMRAALGKESVFFSGEQAVKEVAKANGIWNWALVGHADADMFNLFAGGAGVVEDMQEALGSHPYLSGVVRMTFAHPGGNTTKWVSVHAPYADNGDKMVEALKLIVDVSAKAQLRSQDDCTSAFVIDALRKAATVEDADVFTEDNYLRAKQQESLEVGQTLGSQEEKARAAEKMQPPPLEEPVHDVEPPDAFINVDNMRQRQKMKPLKVGDQVEIYSVRNNNWCYDGEVAEFVDESTTRDTVKLRAGSMKVTYSSGTQFKWLPPSQFQTHVRESIRPRPPTRKVGQLTEQTRSWFVDLNRGFLRWWPSEQEMLAKQQPAKCFSLLGLQMQEPEGDGTSFKVRSDGTRGVFYCFDCQTKEAAHQWCEALWEHSEYCWQIRELQRATDQNIEVRRELRASVLER